MLNIRYLEHFCRYIESSRYVDYECNLRKTDIFTEMGIDSWSIEET